VLRTAAGPVRVDGRIIGAVTVTSDVTDERRAADELRAARDAAEAASRAKSEFLAVMSHELRTPLNAIAGYAELLELGLRGPLTEPQRLDLARIRKSQAQLLGLVEHVLDYARMERGARQHDVTDVLLADALAAGEATSAPLLHARGLRFRVEPCDPRLTVRADTEALQQIVVNLLTNAAKFTEPGGHVTLRCDVSSTDVAIHVVDTGRGIAPADLERIFEPFVQVDSRLTRAHDGIGLGLAISRDLARATGGELTVVSALGVGSTFTLRFPRSG
jgi:signal transduction histidine kinase